MSILSDTRGVNFGPYLKTIRDITLSTWTPLVPKEAGPPTLAAGCSQIRFKLLPNGNLESHSMVLEGRTTTASLDRAAWGAITGSKYPPLPGEFDGEFLELRLVFLYNKSPKTGCPLGHHPVEQ